jgi:hypothetical protein
MFENKTSFSEVNQLAEEARRRAEMARSDCCLSSISTERGDQTLHCPVWLIGEDEDGVGGEGEGGV